mgnify:FL=1
MAKKYTFTYEEPLLDEHNRYPELIKEFQASDKYSEMQEETKKDLVKKEEQKLVDEYIAKEKVIWQKSRKQDIPTDIIEEKCRNYLNDPKFKDRIKEFKKENKEYKATRNANKYFMNQLNIFLQEADLCNYEQVKKWASGKSRPKNGRQQAGLDSFLNIKHWESRFDSIDEVIKYVFSIWDNWINLFEQIREELQDIDDESQMFYTEDTVKQFLRNSVVNLPVLDGWINLMFDFEIKLYNYFGLKDWAKDDKLDFSASLKEQISLLDEAIKEMKKEGLNLTTMDNFHASLVRNANKMQPKFLLLTNQRKYHAIELLMQKVPNSSYICSDEFENDYDKEKAEKENTIEYYGENNFEIFNQLSKEAKFIKILFEEFREKGITDLKYYEAFSDFKIDMTLEDKMVNLTDSEPHDFFNVCAELIGSWLQALISTLDNIGSGYTDNYRF